MATHPPDKPDTIEPIAPPETPAPVPDPMPSTPPEIEPTPPDIDEPGQTPNEFPPDGISR